VAGEQNTLIIKILGALVLIGMVGIVVLDVLQYETDAVQIVVSAAVGALAAKLTADVEPPAREVDPDELELIGRRLNRQLIAQFLREASDPDIREPKN
jgi:hypothetical protein